MGERGPLPKRSDQRRRRNTIEGPPLVKAPSPTPVLSAPPACEDWHPIAAQWYGSLSRSGQARFYEASDWATAVYLAEAMSRTLVGRMSAQLVASVMSGMTDLLTTEGARRRARVELQKVIGDPDADAAEAVVLSLVDELGG